MIEVRGNLWTYKADFRVITTNGFVKKNGRLVMGRGCAKEARDMFPDLDLRLGANVRVQGNKPHFDVPSGLFTLPVKHNWWEKADIALIERSVDDLCWLVPSDCVVVMPRAGCGNGGLSWENQVKPVLETFLDDRFHVITF